MLRAVRIDVDRGLGLYWRDGEWRLPQDKLGPDGLYRMTEAEFAVSWTRSLIETERVTSSETLLRHEALGRIHEAFVRKLDFAR